MMWLIILVSKRVLAGLIRIGLAGVGFIFVKMLSSS